MFIIILLFYRSLLLTPIPAEWIFPYWKNPELKAKFTVQIIHKKTETALSNIGATNIYEAETMVYTVFNITSPIFTHFIVAAIVPTFYQMCAKHIMSDKITITSREQLIKSTFYAQTLIVDLYRLIRNWWNSIIPLYRNVTYLILPGKSINYETIVTTEFVAFR